MQLRRPLIAVSLIVAAGFGACTLNPQPLPPRDENAAANADASADGASGFGNNPSPPAEDAGTLDTEGGTPSGDAGDGGDGSSDAATDAADSG
jgi:hypothetical protein